MPSRRGSRAGFGQHPLVGFFHGAEQRSGVAVERARPESRRRIHRQLRGAFAAAGAAHAIGQQVKAEFRNDPERILVVGADFSGIGERTGLKHLYTASL